MWHSNEKKLKEKVADYTSHASSTSQFITEINTLQCFRKFFTDEWVEYICSQSKLYAEQHSLSCNHVTPKNMKVFVAILLLSAYNKLPDRHLFWAESMDVSKE